MKEDFKKLLVTSYEWRVGFFLILALTLTLTLNLWGCFAEKDFKKLLVTSYEWLVGLILTLVPTLRGSLSLSLSLWTHGAASLTKEFKKLLVTNYELRVGFFLILALTLTLNLWSCFADKRIQKVTSYELRITSWILPHSRSHSRYHSHSESMGLLRWQRLQKVTSY